MQVLSMLKELPPPEKSLTTLSQYVVVKMTNDLQKINIKKTVCAMCMYGRSSTKSEENDSLTVALF